MEKLIYMDNAATTSTAPEVVSAMLPFFTEYYGNPSSVYNFAQKSKMAIEDAREIIAVSIGAAWALFHYGQKLDTLLGTETAAYAYGAAGSTLGTGLGALSGLLLLVFLILAYRRFMKRKMASDRSGNEESTADIY